MINIAVGLLVDDLGLDADGARLEAAAARAGGTTVELATDVTNAPDGS